MNGSASISTADLFSLLKTKKSFKLIKNLLKLNSDIFIVGGHIRKLLQGKDSHDIDVITTDPFEPLAETLAKEIKATVVNFQKGGITRLVSGPFTIDFSRMQGTLYEDLSKRDFTVNAIAWSPLRGIIDPFGGIYDIKKKTIRAISEDNLKKDPLRMLRAYRIVAEDGYRIQKGTRLMIKKLKEKISLTAKERITSELFKILNSSYYIKAIEESFEDALLMEIIAINRDKLIENIKILPRMERFINSIRMTAQLNMDPNSEYSQGLTYLGLLRLERLLMGANLDKNKLAFSRTIRKRLESLQRAFKKYHCKKSPVDDRTLFEIFYELKEASIDFAIILGKEKVFQEAQRFLKLKDIISGDKLVKLTGLRGKRVGDLLKEIRYVMFTSAKQRGYT